jgi:hypothetical protein
LSAVRTGHLYPPPLTLPPGGYPIAVKYIMCCHGGMIRVKVTVLQFVFLVGPGVGLDVVPPHLENNPSHVGPRQTEVRTEKNYVDFR